MVTCRWMKRHRATSRAGGGAGGVDAGLARIEHELWPLSSLKGTDDRAGARKAKKQQDEKRERRSQRHEESDWKRFLTDKDSDDPSDDGTPSSGHY
jgi:hypothetical protein